MPLFRSSTSSAPVQPRSWLRRHKFFAAAVVVVVVAAGLAVWQPWEPCGNGMRTVGTSSDCVGIDVDNTSFGDNDATRDLRALIDEHNAKVAGQDSVTVVVLDNMTPSTQTDSIDAKQVQHGVAGALAAASRANTEQVARETSPQVKLKLANYGASNEEAEVAAQAIIDARASERIVAVVGLGQSLSHTRLAATRLSDEGLAVVSGMASADDMNRRFQDDSTHTERFYRITPTNIDAAKAAVGYLKSRKGKLVLVHDTNSGDIYSRTLAEAFRSAYWTEFGERPGEEDYSSPTDLVGISREKYMEDMFADVFARICTEQPDQVYFAGRGADLAVFLKTIASSGICVNDLNLDVITSDDASALVHRPLPEFAPKRVRVFYTSVATQGQWDHADPPQPDSQAQYRKFEDAFNRLGLTDNDPLTDGYAMSVHDALLVATAAARGFEAPAENYKQVSNWIKKFDCKGPFSGVTGEIAYQNDTARQGNPVGKAMPIMRLEPNGHPVQESLVWPSGQPFGPQSCE
ncbi:amino acid ABC transporter substrate-binding protein [Saccharopolyspora karakumensis]|uniref:Amino acid ABC transporter substrate-binding protein n=1 Tax=Saccharopolyspora karakumensis TaxID=2530386 RepID=A0A4R5BZ49_9PSEU|nr:amino acid ABC transporter substrate-binding protein [Saccharopolyspora karakumensis]